MTVYEKVMQMSKEEFTEFMLKFYWKTWHDGVDLVSDDLWVKRKMANFNAKRMEEIFERQGGRKMEMENLAKETCLEFWNMMRDRKLYDKNLINQAYQLASTTKVEDLARITRDALETTTKIFDVDESEIDYWRAISVLASIREVVQNAIEDMKAHQIVTREEFGGDSPKLKKAKEIVEKYFTAADCGIFNTRNIVGDHMETLYKDDEITIDICYHWSYFEVFGLSANEFKELDRFYNDLSKKATREFLMETLSQIE